MRKFLAIVLLFSFHWVIAQENTTKITVSFTNVSIPDALSSIEQKTDYKFYYIEDWFDNKLISGSFQDTSVSDILDAIFKETVINYFVSADGKIILTQNNLIYDKLPEGFLDEGVQVVVDDEEYESDKVNPVFNNQEKSARNSEIETIRIGKENRNNNNKRFLLSGYIRDVKTGRGLPDVAIIVKDRNTGTSTDGNGYYEISLPAGLNVLQTKSLGLENSEKNVIIYNNGRLDIELDEDYEELDAILLEANKDSNVKEANTGVTNINVKEIKNIPLVLGERDILKVATTLPGITTAGEGASGYNVRGGKTDQNLILLDDAVIYNPSHFFGIFSAINPFTSGDVNIYKGNIPAEYGGRLSSVFDIETKEANVEKFSGEGAIGPVTSNLVLEVPLVKEKAGLLVGGRTTYSNWILRSLDEESLKKSKASFFDIVAKYNHKIDDKNDLKVTGYYSKDEFSITSDSIYGYSNRLGSLRWDHKFNDKNRGSLIIANSQYKFNIDYEASSDNDFKIGYDINETELKLILKYILSDKHKFDYGVSGKLYNVNPGTIEPINSGSIIDELTIPKEKALEAAVFLSDEFTVSEKLLLNAGIRYSFYSALGPADQRVYQEGVPKNESSLIDTVEYGNNESIETYGGPEVRVSGRYFITESFSVKASYNNTYQYIHTLSNNTTVSPTDTWKLSDSNIKPQEANQYSLGFYKNFDDDAYELSVEGYYKKSKNILDFKVGSQLLLNETIETEVLQGDGKSYGVEFLLRKTKGKLNGWLGYSYSRSYNRLDSEFREERVNNGEYFPSNYDKPHDISMVANYKLTRRFSVSANFVYQTGRPITYPVGTYNYNGAEYVLYSDRNQFRIPDYYRLDLSINIEGNHKLNKLAHSFWNISVYNVLGRNNPYSVFFVTEGGEVKAFQSSIFSRPIPTITYNFKF